MLSDIDMEVMDSISKLRSGEITLADFTIFVLKNSPISEEVEKEAVETIKKLFQKKGVGSPKKTNDESILILKIIGYTQIKIVEELRVSRSTVQRAWLKSKLEESLRLELSKIEMKENDNNGKKDS